jgi:hypothetical protein
VDVIFVPFDSSWERSEFRVLVMARALRLADRLNSWIQCSTSSLAQSRRVLHSLAGARAPQGQEHTECSAPVGPRGIFFSMVQQQAPGSGIWSSEIGSPEIPDAFVGSLELMAVPKRKVHVFLLSGCVELEESVCCLQGRSTDIGHLEHLRS